MDNLDFDNVPLQELKKESDLPKVVEDQVEETWLVSYNNETIGVGIFPAHSDQCVMAIIGDSSDNRVVLGSYGTSDEPDDHVELIVHGLEISYHAYLRSIRGDTVLGDLTNDK